MTIFHLMTSLPKCFQSWEIYYSGFAKFQSAPQKRMTSGDLVAMPWVLLAFSVPPMPTLQCVIRCRLLHSPGGCRTVGTVWDMSSFIEWCCRLEDWLIQIYIYIWGTPHLHWIIGRPQCIIEPFFKGQWQFPCTTLLAGNVSKCASWLWNSPDKMLGGGPAETRLWGVIQGSVLNLFICMSSHPG